MKKSTCVVLLAVATLVGCRQKNRVPEVAEMGEVDTAQVFSEYFKNGETRTALVHLVFVPDIDIDPGSAHTAGNASGGTFEELKYQSTFSVHDRSGRETTLTMHPVHVRNLQTLEAEGRSYPLSAGNIFFFSAARDGALRVVQLPPTAIQFSRPEDLVAYMKQQLPNEARLQAIDLTKH